MKDIPTKRGAVFQDSLFDSSRIVERNLAGGTLIRLRLEPLGDGKVRVLEYHRKHKTGSWQRCKEEEGRVMDYAKLLLRQAYDQIFGKPEPPS